MRKTQGVPAQRNYPESRVNRIAELEVGQSESAAIRLTFGKGLDKDMVAAMSDSLRNSLAKAADVAAKRSGHLYTTETGEFFVAKGDIIVTAVATRTR